MMNNFLTERESFFFGSIILFVFPIVSNDIRFDCAETSITFARRTDVVSWTFLVAINARHVDLPSAFRST